MFCKLLKWFAIIAVIAFAALVVYRAFVLYGERKTAERVDIIHATKLTLADVMGEHLPPPPEHPDATVAGVDANGNGIRDDVEIAIFAAYSNSARTRAVLLQYALALQMEVTQPLVNEGTVTAVAEDGERAYSCVGKILSRVNLQEYITKSNSLRIFVEAKQLNTDERKKTQESFYQKLTSHTSPRESCDIDLTTLPN